MRSKDRIGTEAVGAAAATGTRTALTVVVPATDRPPTLERCLDAIRHSTEPPEQIVVVTEPSVRGPAQARNAAVRAAVRDDAAEEIVVFVDADVLVHPDALTRIRDRFDNDAGLSAVFGSYDDAPEARGLVSRFRNLLHHHVHQGSSGPAGTFWSGLGAVRRSDFIEAGEFDGERFNGPCVEDIDLGMRLVAAGRRIELDASLLGTHLKRWTLRSMVRTDLLHRGIPWTALMVLRGGTATHLNLGWAHRISALMSVLVVVAALGALVEPPIIAFALAAASLAAVATLNGRFMLLLGRKSPMLAATGPGLLVVHYLAAVLSVVPGIALGLRWRLEDARRPAAGRKPEALETPDLLSALALAAGSAGGPPAGSAVLAQRPTSGPPTAAAPIRDDR